MSNPSWVGNFWNRPSKDSKLEYNFKDLEEAKRHAKEEYKSRVLEILDKYRHVPGAHYIKAEIEKL